MLLLLLLLFSDLIGAQASRNSDASPKEANMASGELKPFQQNEKWGYISEQDRNGRFLYKPDVPPCS
jgi:hypothetical protein